MRDFLNPNLRGWVFLQNSVGKNIHSRGRKNNGEPKKGQYGYQEL